MGRGRLDSGGKTAAVASLRSERKEIFPMLPSFTKITEIGEGFLPPGPTSKVRTEVLG